jgi:Leucine-rich repeat (LRR) protein
LPILLQQFCFRNSEPIRCRTKQSQNESSPNTQSTQSEKLFQAIGGIGADKLATVNSRLREKPDSLFIAFDSGNDVIPQTQAKPTKRIRFISLQVARLAAAAIILTVGTVVMFHAFAPEDVVAPVPCASPESDCSETQPTQNAGNTPATYATSGQSNTQDPSVPDNTTEPPATVEVSTVNPTNNETVPPITNSTAPFVTTEPVAYQTSGTTTSTINITTSPFVNETTQLVTNVTTQLVTNGTNTPVMNVTTQPTEATTDTLIKTVTEREFPLAYEAPAKPPTPVFEVFHGTNSIYVTAHGLDLTNDCLTELVENGTIPRDTMHLNLNHNQISDLTPLRRLTNLEVLSLSSNQVIDLSPLRGLTSLTHLSIDRNRINSIAPLTSLTNLELLILCDNLVDLEGNQLKKSGAEGGLILWYLHVPQTQFSDTNPLSKLTNLIWLNVYKG